MSNAPSLLPPNATATERRLEQVGARISDIPTPVRDMWNPDACPVALLPWLAWGFGVDEWDSDWSEAQKRSAIKNALFVQKHKGTIGSVKRALAALGYDIVVQEWFNQIPAGDPGTFDVLLDSNQTGIDQAALTRILELIDRYKNLRSHLVRVRPSVTTRGGPILAGVCTVGHEITVPFDGPQYSDGSFAYDLMLDAMHYGEASTVGALDQLDTIVRAEMPSNSWKQQ
ncbi:phage tail protein, P2 protein I family [Paraburkholderia lycopersici]|uniref:Phage tail protein, P2 protein I family n=2 Tax=Paraburkholderia lycopersici TaxID=416944 RepID=A0A1G7CQY1_9BURK|nr:phage tail protein, P2 protein I family [Paraburkholderia lycopersici]